jgi:hypothetical protein
VQITARALELFVESERAARARRRATDCTIGQYGHCMTDCRACRAWFAAHSKLHFELKLTPWFWPCLPRNPYPPGSPGARDWRPDAEQEQLWGLLDAARRSAVVATAPSSKEESPDVEPVAGPGTFT